MIVVAFNPCTGENGRINLGGAINLDISERNWGQGVDLLAVYLQPKARRVILHTNSRWEDRRHPGRTMGEGWFVAEDSQIAHLAKEFDCEELTSLLPEFSDL